MERSELLLKTGHGVLLWDEREDDKRHYYTAKTLTPFGKLSCEYKVAVNKNPNKVYASVYLSYFSPYHQGYIVKTLCKNEVGSAPMSVDELIKVANDDYYGSLERYAEYQDKRNLQGVDNRLNDIKREWERVSMQMAMGLPF